MAELEAEKALAASRAIQEVSDGMIVGLGTGSTTGYAIRELGRRVQADGLSITAVATSDATRRLAESVGIAITPFDAISRLDLVIDGADEVDPYLRAIKGGGGALLREKVAAAAADRTIIIVDSSKPVARLGRFHLPVEVLPFAGAFARRRLKELGAPVTIRLATDGTPILTDQGNLICTVALGGIDDPVSTALKIDAIPGVLEHGLFLDEIDLLIVARGDQTEILSRI